MSTLHLVSVNPACRRYVINRLPGLTCLDSTPVTDLERAEGERLYSSIAHTASVVSPINKPINEVKPPTENTRQDRKVHTLLLCHRNSFPLRSIEMVEEYTRSHKNPCLQPSPIVYCPLFHQIALGHLLQHQAVQRTTLMIHLTPQSGVRTKMKNGARVNGVLNFVNIFIAGVLPSATDAQF